MADIPVPRSYQQILGDTVDAFVSRTGISALKVGSPILSLMEAVAQSQLRDSEDVFSLLNSISLDRATGTALESIASDEGLARKSAAPSFGYVTFTDTGFTKVQTTLSEAVAVGATVLKVPETYGFVVGDYVIIDKGNANVEGGSTGPSIQITAITPSSTNVNGTITVSPALSYPHPPNTPILKRQGGDRIIPAGTAIGQTMVFNVVASATIEDGETIVEEVPVVCSVPGTQSNVAANSVNTINSTLPFNGEVTNPLPFINGVDQETDASLRDRIRTARQTRQRATSLAIRTALDGVTAADERKRIVSTSLVDTGLGKASLYIDDGTGYEAKTSAIALETVCYSASGGEQYFELQGGKPVAKAFVESGESAPFIIAADESIEVLIGGIPYTHSFVPTDFVDRTKATVYEVVESINANTTLGFYATTSDNRSKVRLIAKTDINETITVVDQDLAFSFPSTPSSTLYLFKNNTILTKDGKDAFVVSQPVGNWNDLGALTSLDFSYQLDNATSDITITITDADFSTHTSYSTIAQGYRDTAAWAEVLNQLVVGARFEYDANRITMFSNRGKTSEARVLISGTSNNLVSLGIFQSNDVSNGISSDYTLNRSKGQIYLTSPLVQGDVLVAGSIDIRAPLISVGSLPSTFAGATFDALWLVLDDEDAAVIQTGIKSGESVTVSYTAAAGLTPKLLNIAGPASTFTNVQAGDWVIIFDSSFGVPFGSDPKTLTKKVYSVDSTYSTISVIEDTSPEPISAGAYTISNDAGVVVVRSSEIPQSLVVNPYSSYSELAEDLTAQLNGGHCTVSSTGKVSFFSNSYRTTGSVALVAANTNAYIWMGQARGTVTVTNPSDYQQSVVSDAQTAVPSFQSIVASVAPTSDPTLLGKISVFTHAGDGKLSEQSGFSSLYLDSSTYRKTLNDPYFTTSDFRSVYSGYQISDTDTIGFFLDGDQVNRSYSSLLSVSGTINSSGVISLDSGVPPSTYFGGRSLKDWGLWIDNATATPVSQFSDSSTASITFKSVSYGPNTLVKKVQYVYPTAPNQNATAFVKSIPDWNSTGSTSPYATIPNGIVSIRLPSGAEKTFGNPTQILSLQEGLSPSNTQRLICLYDGELGSVPPASTYNAIFYNMDPAGYPYIANQITAGSAIKIFLSGGTTFDTTVTVAPYYLTPTQYQFEFSPGVPTSVPSTTIQFIAGSDGTALTSNYDFSAFAENDIINVPSNQPYISAGSYRVTAVDPSYEYIDVVTGFTASNGGFRTDPGGAFAANAVKFFPLGTTPLSTLEDESLVTVQTASLLPVVRSTDEYYNFVTTSIDSDGLITSSGSVDFVSTCNTTTYAITSKNGASFTSGTAIKLIPITAQNIADSINSFMNENTIEAEVANYDGDRVELVRSEEGSDKSLQMVDSKSNSAEFKSLGIVQYETGFDPYSFDRPSPASAYALLTTKTNTQPFVTGSVVKLESKKPILVSQSAIGSVTVSLGNLASTQKLWNVWNDAFSPTPGTPYVAESLKWSVKKIGNFALYKLVGNTVTNPSVSDLRTYINYVNSVGSFVKIRNFEYVVDNVDLGLSKVVIADFDKAFNQVTTNDIIYINDVAKTVTSTASDGFVINDISGVSAGQSITGISTTAVTANSGLFRVVRVYAPSDDNICFWVENPDAVDGIVTLSTTFLGQSSIMEGDAVSVSTFSSTVIDIPWYFADLAGDYSNAIKKADVSYNGPSLAFLTVAVTHSRNEPEYAYGTIGSMVLIPSDQNAIGLAINGFDQYDYGWLGADTIKGECTISACNKLNFSLTAVAKNADAYDYYTGLIGEANKITYGDTQDSITYPGYAAATANIEILPPQIRRIQVQITVRMQGGFSITDSVNAIRSAAASAILSTPIGQDVAFSDIVAAVNAVPGVFSAYVTYLSPTSTYSAQNTVINVQANEKPLVIDPENDIQITFVGV